MGAFSHELGPLGLSLVSISSTLLIARPVTGATPFRWGAVPMSDWTPAATTEIDPQCRALARESRRCDIETASSC